MKRIIPEMLVGLVLARLAANLPAQEVSIPDPALNAAVRESLQKPAGPLSAQDMLGLTFLSAGGRDIRSVEGLETARNLGILDLDNNSLTNFPIAGALTNLTILDLFENHLSRFVLAKDAPHLRILDISFNSLAQCTLPAGMTNLETLFLRNNQLTNLTLPPDLIRLAQVDLQTNQLTSLTLPPDMTNLVSLNVDGNPLATLVLSEPQSTNLAATVAALQSQGVSVFTYPLTPLLFRIRQPIGAFQFALAGPPGVYAVLASTNLDTWSPFGFVENTLGKVVFTDTTAHFSPQKFYRAVLPSAPANSSL